MKIGLLLIWLSTLAVSEIPGRRVAAQTVSCLESCQYFDSFANTCLYPTQCNYDGECMGETRCQQWDKFSNSCTFESNKKTCHRPSVNPVKQNCEETCQYFDKFPPRPCLYATQCIYEGNCLTIVKCQHWDNFNNVCTWESRQKTCN